MGIKKNCLGDQKIDKGETSKYFWQEDLNIRINTGKERRELNLNHIKRRCVILCGTMLFLHIFMVSVGLRVPGIWG